jgi:hypothetical protein
MPSKAYKLVRHRRDGTLGPLFINRTLKIPFDTWLDAEDHPTKGYAHRPGWHCGLEPVAPHLSSAGRVWAEVEIGDWYPFPRPSHQGSVWVIAKRMRVLSLL